MSRGLRSTTSLLYETLRSPRKTFFLLLEFCISRINPLRRLANVEIEVSYQRAEKNPRPFLMGFAANVIFCFEIEA